MENYMYENQRWQEHISPVFCPHHEPINIHIPYPNGTYYPRSGTKISHNTGFVFPSIKWRAQA